MKNRSPALDIIRCTALFHVVLIHFFLYIGFYDEQTSGMMMYVMHIFRASAGICVPLFLVVSGYLMCSREPSGRYYSKLTRTLGIYVLSSLLCLIYAHFFLDQSFSAFGAVIDTFCFVAAPYSWYVEMYIGLFLIIPFLNILYRHIGDQKGKRLFLLLLILMTTLPSMTNIFRVAGLDWWRNPSSSDYYVQILPDWWTGFYPITYYFLGCYLKEYPIKIRVRYCAVLLVLANLAAGTFSFYRSSGSSFVYGPWQDWGSVFSMLQTTLIFTLLSRLNYGWLGCKGCRLISRLSDWSFGACLVSWIFDDAFYKILIRIQPDVRLRFFYMPLMVPLIFLCAMGLSAVVNLIYAGLEKAVTGIKAGYCSYAKKTKG